MGITVEGNTFLSPGDGTGVHLCGSSLGAVIRIDLEPGNLFDGVPLDNGADCESAESSQKGSCEFGGVFGFTAGSPAAPWDLPCEQFPQNLLP